jgi:hypothetical protein
VEIGEDAARELSRRLGGEIVPIRRMPRADSRLVRAIGEEAARKIADRYMGDKWYIAKAASHKKAAILAATGTIAQIARDLGVSYRYASKVRSGLSRPPRPAPPEDRPVDAPVDGYALGAHESGQTGVESTRLA